MSFIHTPNIASQGRSYTVQVPTQVSIRFHIEEISTGSRIFATYSIDSEALDLEDTASPNIEIGSRWKIGSTETMGKDLARHIWEKYVLPGTSKARLDLATGCVHIPFRARANSI